MAKEVYSTHLHKHTQNNSRDQNSKFLENMDSIYSSYSPSETWLITGGSHCLMPHGASEPLNVWSCVITGTILAKADGSESCLQLLFCATQCLSGIEIRQQCRLRHHFSPVFPQGDCDGNSQLWPVELWCHLMWWYSAQFHCCNMSRLKNGTLNWYGFYLCKEELVEDCPCPPSKYSQGSLAVVSNHINYIGTPKLEDKIFFFVPTWYAEFLLHQCIYNKLHF